MNLVVISFFRNSAHNGQATRFVQLVADLRNMWQRPVRLIAVYGDCVDDTAIALSIATRDADLSLDLVESHHGGPVYGSTEAPERLGALSQICNAGLEAVSMQDDLVWYVESDLLWHPHTVRTLARHVATSVADVAAPLVMAGEAFYDIWGYRKDGTRFNSLPPYHPGFVEGLTKNMDSVGSAFVMNAAVARQCRVRNGQALVGFFEDVRRQSFTILVDSTEKVVHP